MCIPAIFAGPTAQTKILSRVSLHCKCTWALTFENFCQVHLDCFFAPDEMNHDTNQVIKSCVCVCVCLYMYTHTNTHTHTQAMMFQGFRCEACSFNISRAERYCLLCPQGHFLCIFIFFLRKPCHLFPLNSSPPPRCWLR